MSIVIEFNCKAPPLIPPADACADYGIPEGHVRDTHALVEFDVEYNPTQHRGSAHNFAMAFPIEVGHMIEFKLYQEYVD